MLDQIYNDFFGNMAIDPRSTHIPIQPLFIFKTFDVHTISMAGLYEALLRAKNRFIQPAAMIPARVFSSDFRDSVISQ